MRKYLYEHSFLLNSINETDTINVNQINKLNNMQLNTIIWNIERGQKSWNTMCVSTNINMSIENVLKYLRKLKINLIWKGIHASYSLFNIRNNIY